MNNLKDLVKEIERDLVINITLSVKYGRIDLRDARKIAKEFMAGYPYKNKSDLFNKIDFLTDEYKIVRKVYVKHVPKFRDEETEKLLEVVRKYIKNGEIEEAIIVAKEEIYG